MKRTIYTIQQWCIYFFLYHLKNKCENNFNEKPFRMEEKDIVSIT